LRNLLQDLRYVLKATWEEESNRGQRIRRLAYLVTWQLWKRLVRPPIQLRLFNGMSFLAYPDCDMSSAAVYYRIPDSRDILFLRAHVHGGTLIDVGANVGLIALLLADKVDHALLFEPNPVAAARARANLAINGLQFEVNELALSDTTGTVEFEDAGGASTCNRIVAGIATNLPTRKVQCTEFDRFLGVRQLSRPITVVKIDVEGHENQVLRGMAQCLKHHRPRLVMFEYLQRTDLQETFRIFESAGYLVLQLSGNGPQLATPQAAPLQNLFACPRELLQEFVTEDPPESAREEVRIAG